MVKKKVKQGGVKMGGSSRGLLILGGFVSLVLGYILWMGIWNLEQVFAILLFIAGFFKIIWGILPRS